MTISEGRSLPERVGTQARWLSETEAAQHCGMSQFSFRRHVLPVLRPIKFSKRLVRYDIQEIDQRLAERQLGGAPSSVVERALGGAFNEDHGARRKANHR